LDKYFSAAHIPQQIEANSFESTSILLKEYQVKKGKECIDTDDTLFKVTAVSSGSSDVQDLLVVSMSHTLGDGFTFYTIYSMFEKEPTPMIAERAKEFADQSKSVHGDQYWKFISSTGFIIGVIANLLSSAPQIVSVNIN
jgi:hypothetical protein